MIFVVFGLNYAHSQVIRAFGYTIAIKYKIITNVQEYSGIHIFYDCNTERLESCITCLHDLVFINNCGSLYPHWSDYRDRHVLLRVGWLYSSNKNRNILRNYILVWHWLCHMLTKRCVLKNTWQNSVDYTQTSVTQKGYGTEFPSPTIRSFTPQERACVSSDVRPEFIP